MLIDSQNQFSDQQAVTATGGTASSNIIDLGVSRDIGGAAIERLMLLCQVATAFASGGAANLQVQVQTAPDNGAGAPGSWVTLAQSDAIPVASLIAGYRFLPGPLPGGTQRFLRLNYVVGTAVMTAGKLTAALVPALDVTATYSRGYAA